MRLRDAGEAQMIKPFLASLLAATACATVSLCAVAAKPAPTFKTSFDCATARLPVEKLVCQDARLAQMDLELSRLYLLALTDQRSVPPPDKVEVDQRFWIATRNQCGFEADPKACTIRSYAERAHKLRQGSAIARTKDPSRLTEGPLAFRCAGLNALVAATFFTVQPGVVFLAWANNSIALAQAPGDPGGQFTGKDARGIYSFWQNGSDVLLQIPGSRPMSCTVEPTG